MSKQYYRILANFPKVKFIVFSPFGFKAKFLIFCSNLLCGLRNIKVRRWKIKRGSIFIADLENNVFITVP